MKIHHHPPHKPTTAIWSKRQREQTHEKANCVIFHNSALARRCAHEYLGRGVMNMHPGPQPHAQIDELLVAGKDKEGANLETASGESAQAKWTGDVCTTCVPCV